MMRVGYDWLMQSGLIEPEGADGSAGGQAGLPVPVPVSGEGQRVEQVGEGADGEADAGDGSSGQGEAECEVINLKLPWPPTVNTYYRTVGGRMLISREGRRYREEVCALLAGGYDTLRGRLAVTVQCHAPDNRRRDLGNLDKCLADTLTKAGIWEDDSQIDDLRYVRRDPIKGGMVLVEIKEIA